MNTTKNKQKNKKLESKQATKSGFHHHYHKIKQKLTPVRIFLLVVLLFLPIITAVLLVMDFQPQNSFAGNGNQAPSREINPIRKPDNQVVEQFSLNETSFINDFSLKIKDFKIVTTESSQYDDFCITSLEVFNFADQTQVFGDQFKLSQLDKNLDLWDKLLPSNPLKLNYSVDLEKNKATNFDIYFVCNNLSDQNLNFVFTPFRINNIQSQKDEFPVFDSQKNQYYSAVKYNITFDNNVKIIATKNLPITIKPIKFELTTVNTISACILRLELTNSSYNTWLLDEADLILQTEAEQKLNRLVVNTDSGGAFRKIALSPGKTETADYAFNCKTKGDYKLKYNPSYIAADFVENKDISLDLSL